MCFCPDNNKIRGELLSLKMYFLYRFVCIHVPRLLLDGARVCGSGTLLGCLMDL